MLGATYATYMIVFMCLQHVELNVCMHSVTAFYNQLVHLSSAYVLGLGELGSVLHLLAALQRYSSPRHRTTVSVHKASGLGPSCVCLECFTL